MTVLNAYLNSYGDYALFAFALVIVFAIIKAFLMSFKAIRKNVKKGLYKF